MPISTLPSSPAGYDFGFAAYPGKGDLGFEYLGNLYTFVTQSTTVGGSHDSKCHAFKSTDAGATWVEMDAANAPGNPTLHTEPNFSNPGLGGPQYTVARDGSIALIFSTQLGFFPPSSYVAVDQTQLIRFDLSTDLWSTITTLSAETDFEYTGNLPFPDTNHVTGTFATLIVLAPGSYVLIYSGAPDTVAGNWWGRLWYVTFNGTSFGTPVKLPNQVGAFTYFGIGARLTASGVIQIIYGNTNASGSVSFYSVGLDTSGFTFGTTQVIANSLAYWNSSATQMSVTSAGPIIYTPSGGSESIAFVAEVFDPTFSFQNLTVFHAQTALNPSWSQSVVTTGTDDTTGNGGTTDENIFPVPQGVGLIGGNLTLAEKGGTIAVAWTVVRASFIGHIYYATAPSDTLGWTSETLLFDNGPITGGSGDTPATQVFAFPMTGGIGVLGGANDYLDGNGNEIMQFDLIPVASPPPTCSLSASPGGINPGQSSTLTWITSGTPLSASIDNGVGPVNPNGGSISVSPSTSTLYTLTVTNSNGSSTCATIVSVGAVAGQCNNPPAGKVGVAYSQTFTATGGTAPYTYAITAGTLPFGLTLASNGVVSGVPTTSGVYFFTVTATDSNGILSSFNCNIPIAC